MNRFIGLHEPIVRTVAWTGFCISFPASYTGLKALFGPTAAWWITVPLFVLAVAGTYAYAFHRVRQQRDENPSSSA